MKLLKLGFFLLVLISLSGSVFAQMNFDGDFRIRFYNDRFFDTRDNRQMENYVRYLSRIRGDVKASENIMFNSEVITVVENTDAVSARNIAGTGKMTLQVSQLFADITESGFLGTDLVRFRLGRQPFGVGKGLSFGESYYFLEKFDGARIDAAYKNYTLTLFGAITGQNLSDSGLYPEPGNDHIFTARATAEYFGQSLMGYFINDRPMGLYNDTYTIGGGLAGSFLDDDLEYYGEFAHQTFNTSPMNPEQGGIGYMGSVSYQWAWGPFRRVKVETRYAAFQGDDPATEKIEMFSPPYPSLFWGDRWGYINGEIGGIYPHDGRYPEGSRLWYSRIYFIPRSIPNLRIQFQYLHVNEYEDSDEYNVFNDEFSVRFYYRIVRNAQLQLRYARGIPNDEDRDINESGLLSSSEDRYGYQRIMLEFNLVF